MIRPPGVPGVAFGTEGDGDGRNVPKARASISEGLEISSQWAYADQVHGANVMEVTTSGNHGEADGLTTDIPGLPIAIGTADCVPVVLLGDSRVTMLHAGWRGIASGIVDMELTRRDGAAYSVAVIGPHIGPCCYEVGPDVVAAIGGFANETSWGTVSADLGEAIVAQVDGRIPIVDLAMCTRCDDRFASHRRNGTRTRQVSLAWL